MSKLYDYIKDNFKEGEPILFKDLVCFAEIANIKRESLSRSLQRLIKDGKLFKANKGIYCLPYKSLVNDTYLSSLDSSQIIMTTYMNNRDDVYGYAKGLFFEHNIGLTNQVPFTWQIVSNNYQKRIEDIPDNVNLLIYKPKVKITKDNQKVLEILDLFDSDEEFDSDEISVIQDYIKENQISLDDFKKYINKFDKSFKRIIETGVLNVFTQ